MGGKATDRQAKKQAAKAVDDDEAARAGGAPDKAAMLAMAKQLVLDSVLVKLAPKVPDLLKEGAPAKEPAAKEENAPETETPENDADSDIKKAPASSEPATPARLFDDLVARLPFYNALGLGLPASGEEAKEKWLGFKSLEVDGGPRARKKGNPAADRMLANLQGSAPQYLHLLLALMMLRAFLFRSYFACLPWLVGYQVLSLVLPLEWPEYPQVPKVEVKFRVAASAGLHGLVWLFFLFETIYQTHFIEKLLLVGLFAAHAYVVVPAA